LFTQPEDTVRVGKYLLARSGEFHVPPVPIEQRLAQAALQLLNLRRKGGLRSMNLPGCVRERSDLGYTPEVKQMPEVQLTYIHKFYFRERKDIINVIYRIHEKMKNARVMFRRVHVESVV
jgi:hypothetical protein